MPSPFPGMDPWLERHWGDVHTRLLTYASDRLQGRLPRDLRARVEEQVYLEYPDDDPITGRPIVPDIRVVEYPRVGPAAEQGGVATLVPTEPLVVEVQADPVTQRWIEIRDFSTGGKLITVIEVMSPSNKCSPKGRELYTKKRFELDDAGVHLVEIDLLRSGEPLEPLPRTTLGKAYQTPYLVTVTREMNDQWRTRKYEIYKVPLRERLPVIRIPLRSTDQDVFLDLQAVLNDAYDRGGYDIIDYTQPPDPPLTPDDGDWAASVIADRRAHSV